MSESIPSYTDLSAQIDRLGKSMLDLIENLQAERDSLQDALQDISRGANIMLDSPPMKAVHSYAAEVKRVADAALGRKT